MAIATQVGSVEHHYDPTTQSRHFVLSIDLLGVTVAGLLWLLSLRSLHHVWKWVLRSTD